MHKILITNLKEDTLIDILIGARRVGKTRIIYSLINKLLDNGIKSRHILYLTGELREIENLRIIDIVNEFKKKFQLKLDEKIYILIDEVQEIDEWQKDVKFLYDNFKLKFYLTGSSSLILNNQTSKLTERFLLSQVLPLDFKEYLTFKKQKITNNSIKNQEVLENYLRTGGYPEFVLRNQQDYLMQVIESTLYRDLLNVYGIRNPTLLKDLLYYLSHKITNPVSIKTIEKDLGVNDVTVKFYLKYLQDVYLIYPVYKYGRSHRITKSSNPKYYLNDTGLLYNISLNKRISYLAENAVYLKLLEESPSKEYPSIYYYNDKDSKQEVDFIDGKRNLYGVKYKDKLIEKEDIQPYELLDKEIRLISTEKINIRSINMYNLKPTTLSKFLLE